MNTEGTPAYNLRSRPGQTPAPGNKSTKEVAIYDESTIRVTDTGAESTRLEITTQEVIESPISMVGHGETEDSDSVGTTPLLSPCTDTERQIQDITSRKEMLEQSIIENRPTVYNYRNGQPLSVGTNFIPRTNLLNTNPELAEKLCEGLDEVKVDNGKNSKVEFKNSESEVVFSLGKKEFSHLKHRSIFVDEPWLKEFDKEMEGFCNQLFEFPISFPPSYPFVEDNDVSSDYMHTRCPAWCDRVVLSQTAKPLISSEDDGKLEYSLIGMDSCMGDHKPVYLKGNLTCGAGRLSCCETYPSVNCDETVLFDLGPDTDIAEDTVIAGKEAVVGAGRDVVVVSPLTERFIVKRVHSASIVEVKVGLVKVDSCRGWRTRSCSVSNSAKPPTRAFSRMRLISSEASLTRVQSHHSSSSEEWFEEEKPPSPPSPVPETQLKTKQKNKCCILL